METFMLSIILNNSEPGGSHQFVKPLLRKIDEREKSLKMAMENGPYASRSAV